MFNWSKIWEENGIIENSYFANLHKTVNDGIYLFKDISKGDSFFDILIYPFHSGNNSKEFQYEILKEKMENSKKSENSNTLEIYVSYDSWEHERKIINDLKSKESNAIARNKIENDFGIFNSVYFSESNFIELKIDQDGINYLESPKCPNKNISAVVVNCSFLELKKLYNLTGVKLFKNNVRDGIIDSKSEIKAIFKQYLSVIDEKIDSKYNNFQDENKLNDFSAELFWFSHNGITLFIDENVEDSYSFSYDTIRINTKSCSVINGAQTITNFFLVYSELKNTYEINDEKEKIIRLEELLSNLFVKLTIIVSDVKYSPFITKGLNTQIPITLEDFIAISKEVEEINEVAIGYVYILKTGQIPREGGVSPLQFVKQYLIVTSRPGTAKNFNKNELENKIKEINSELILKGENDCIRLKEDKKEILEKLSNLSYIEDWWNKKNHKKLEKDIIDNYGKNYFQSFVLDFYKETVESKSDLDNIYKKFIELININSVQITDFKKDKLYGDIKSNHQKNLKSIKRVKNIPEYKQKLVNYLNKMYKTNIDYESEVRFFNEDNEFKMNNLKVIIIKDNKVQEPLYLSSKTFKSIYQGLNIEERLVSNRSIEKNDFEEFTNSLLYKELNLKYDLIVVEENGEKVEKIDFHKNCKFDILDKHKQEVERIYNNVITSFIEGNIEKLVERNNKVIGTKVSENDGNFIFTTGEQVLNIRFIITENYIESFLKLLKDKEN